MGVMSVVLRLVLVLMFVLILVLVIALVLVLVLHLERRRLDVKKLLRIFRSGGGKVQIAIVRGKGKSVENAREGRSNSLIAR